jgi:hypothetical protein
MPFDASKYRSFVVRMRITPNPSSGLGKVTTPDMRIKWGTAENPIIEKGVVVDNTKRVASVPVKVDGKFHEYRVDLTRCPDWNGVINELWFEACQVMHARVAVDWMRFE